MFINTLLESDYGLECQFGDDLIGEEIKGLDLRFHYKGRWQSLDGIETIDFIIRKNPPFDLVLGQDWLWIHKAKIVSSSKNKSLDHSDSRTETDSSESNSYNCPQKKKSKADHYTTASGESKLGLKLEELTNMIKKSLSDAEDNMHMTVSAKKHPIRKRKVKDDDSLFIGYIW
ncbi:11442_t:CDS:2 [Entrophospora sp. SA101]|nr:11442_t:CDS:2 [Entrophospora sp. SA101]